MSEKLVAFKDVKIGQPFRFVHNKAQYIKIGSCAGLYQMKTENEPAEIKSILDLEDERETPVFIEVKNVL